MPLRPTLRRPPLELATHRRPILVDRANEAPGRHVDDERRAMSFEHRHVTAVSDEDGQVVGPSAEARVVDAVDPDERGKFRETARPAPEAGWGGLGCHC